MSRRLPLVAVAAAMLLAACGGPTAPALTDPTEILTRSVEALGNATSVHLKADVDGEVPFDPTGQGAGGPLDLAGTSLEGDIDIAGSKAKLTFAVPALLNIGGEIVQIDRDSYVKLTGPFATGDKYQHSTSTGADDPTAIAGDPKAAIADLQKALGDLSSPPTKGADEKCGDRDCYKVSVALAADDLGDLASAAPGLVSSADLDVLVRKDDLRPARLTVTAAGGDQGTLTISIELSDYDAGVSISAPPADQVEEGGLDGFGDLLP